MLRGRGAASAAGAAGRRGAPAIDARIAAFLDALARGDSVVEPLAEAGAPDPARAAENFAKASAHPDLAPTRTLWAPALLLGARPGFAAQSLDALARRHRDACGTALDVARAPALPLVLASSNFLTRLVLQHPDWCADLAGTLPPPPSPEPPAADWAAVRAAKYRGLLRVAARDLAGRPFAEGFRELTILVDGCLTAALRCAEREEETPAPALLALGKLGGCEPNFASDVDLLFVYDNPQGVPEATRRQAVERFVRRLKGELERPTEDGFGFRVDLDLRPEGATGVLANPVDAALAYYESFGAEWERQALIRLRAVAGAPQAARAFSGGVLPFVYRRAIGPEVLGAVRAMKTRIEDERRRAGRDIEMELKEGPGGIRDVEFLVQALQLFLGGREPSLRTGNVLAALAALERLQVLPSDTVRELEEAYLWLRRAEHALQLVEERQTHRFPRDPGDQLALARRLGYADASGARARARLLETWSAVRFAVRRHFDALVLEGDVEPGA